ncbi:MAG: PspC domain-containing protein [Bacteroidales bacterium]
MKRFYRSNNKRILAGVAAGLGKYFQIDPVLIRILFVILALAGGGGLLAYILLAICAPMEND